MVLIVQYDGGCAVLLMQGPCLLSGREYRLLRGEKAFGRGYTGRMRAWRWTEVDQDASEQASERRGVKKLNTKLPIGTEH